MDKKLLVILVLFVLIAGFMLGTLTGDATRRKRSGGSVELVCDFNDLRPDGQVFCCISRDGYIDANDCGWVRGGKT